MRHREDIERSKVITRSARMRLEDALESYRRSRTEDIDEDPLKKYEDPPEVPRERSRKGRLWSWNKLMRSR